MEPIALGKWQQLRAELERRQEARQQQRRFRRNPAAYLRQLEKQLLKPGLPASYIPTFDLQVLACFIFPKHKALPEETMKKYKVTLTGEERQELLALIAAGTAGAKKLAHARILLKADASDSGPAWPDARSADAVEVSVTQCLDRRIESRAEMERQVSAWPEDRADRQVQANWQFTTADARRKLRKLYPVTQ